MTTQRQIETSAPPKKLEDLRIVFAGTPDFAAQHLSALLATKCNIVGVFTQPDRPAGRGKKLTASAVKEVALAHNLPVFQPEKLREVGDQSLVADLNADIMIVVAYGLILPKAVLDMPKLGCLNVHGSLLPRWRGAAPIQRAIWAGDEETGITIMQMDVGLDTGDMLYKVNSPITPEETSTSLYAKLANLGPTALIECLNALLAGELTPEKQQEESVSYAHKLSKEEAFIDWKLSAKEIERCIRAFNPWPMSYFVVEETNIKVWKASVLENSSTLSAEHKPAGTLLKADKSGLYFATGSGVLCITELQPAGSKPMPVEALLNSKMAWFSVNKVYC